MESPQKLADFPVSHAGRKRLVHPKLQREILAQTAVRYLRFLRPVRLDHVTLPALNTPGLSGRWVPNVPTHPAHLLFSLLDRRENRWRVVAEAELPANPRFAGEGLSQDMPMEAMEAFFRQAVAEQRPHRIEFGGFSNNTISTNCHVNQHTAFDFAAFTSRPAISVEPLEWVKFSVGRGLLDGGGYGYHRSLYLDSDPILLSGAGRVVQLSDDRRADLKQGFADGKFHGPYGTGKEFMTWNGADSGYEGTFGPNSGPLHAIAVERGNIAPPTPEWWLAAEGSLDDLT
jgi:hypothetical protein